MSRKLHITAPVDPVTIGKMGSVYGIRGWLRVFSSTEATENIFNYRPWFIKKVDAYQLIGLEGWRRHNKDLIIKVRGVEDRETATLLTNHELVVDAAQLPDLNSGEYYWKDLLKCQVIIIGGYQLGRVINLIETGSNDVLVVKTNTRDTFGIRERLIPFLNGKVIKKVDLATHVIEVDWDPTF